MLVVEKASSGQKKVLFYRFTISADLHQLAPLNFVSTIGHENLCCNQPSKLEKNYLPGIKLPPH